MCGRSLCTAEEGHGMLGRCVQLRKCPWCVRSLCTAEEGRGMMCQVIVYKPGGEWEEPALGIFPKHLSAVGSTTQAEAILVWACLEHRCPECLWNTSTVQ